MQADAFFSDQAPTPAKKPIIPKSKRKTKSKKTAKYVDKRQAKNTDDFMEDPSLYESFDRKILSDNDYGRLNLDSGTFWDVPSAEEELRVELQRITSAVSYPDKSAFARPPVQITILRNEEEVVFVASLHDAVFAAPEKPPVESVFEDLWRTYHAEDPTSEQAATPFWLNRIKKYQAVKSASGEENEGEAEQEGGGEDMFM
ncbi:uncharacterized protein BCR38DRAFT_34948 [Pseudomassariella vexata]|uniref:Uncharacterized protein n=1 Tax=Pseudomassariella vexata TaxID=1141098 RepID=A0A1Y2DQH7_9PEZI|nr:uncharacterized protein BCR38DRAFT_34948 [Pseudomassariella vexata]ORY61457.1 hypothetical protein BCR38DRAFT_34948 [Pseudomassariella vexata]